MIVTTRMFWHEFTEEQREQVRIIVRRHGLDVRDVRTMQIVREGRARFEIIERDDDGRAFARAGELATRWIER